MLCAATCFVSPGFPLHFAAGRGEHCSRTGSVSGLGGTSGDEDESARGVGGEAGGSKRGNLRAAIIHEEVQTRLSETTCSWETSTRLCRLEDKMREGGYKRNERTN